MSNNTSPVISHEEIHTTAPTITHARVDPSQNVAHYNKSGGSFITKTRPTFPVIVQGSKQSQKPKDYVNWSCFIILACNFVLGLFGRHYGLKSNYAWQLGDLNTAKKQSKRAFMFVVFGIICGLLTYSLALMLYLLYIRHKPLPLLKQGPYG